MKRLITTLSILLLVVAACGGDDSSESSAGTDAGSTTEPTATTATGSGGAATGGTCTADVSGDLEAHIDAPSSPVPSASDYWMTDDELAQSGSYLDDFDQRMADGQQITTLLQVSCGSGDTLLLIVTTDPTTRTDVPFGPGTYDVLDYRDGVQVPGISVGVTLPDPSNFGTTGGTIDITRFDDTGVAGSFQIEAEETPLSVEPGAEPRHLTVSGSFDVPCSSLGASACAA